MKKTLFYVVALLIVFNLCACHQHVWVDANCTASKTCSDCGETEGTPDGHDWSDATCIAPKTCTVCGETEGAPTGHSWEDATCTSPKTCSVCGETEGTTTEHSWKNATCTSPKTCASCGKTEGTTISHSWKDATCTSPKTCASCGKTEGTTINHSWKDATCTSPKTCTSCGRTEGTTISHGWENATCTSPKTCFSCGKTEGSALGHNWQTVNDYTKQCNTCGAQEIDQSKRPVSLGSLTPCSGGKYYSSADRKDIYGNNFSEGLVFSLFKESDYKVENERSTEYVLNNTYRKFTATTMVDADSRENFEGRLRIYVDNVLVFDSNTITKKSPPINIEIDISNATFIRFYGTCNISLYGTRGYIMLENPILHH